MKKRGKLVSSNKRINETRKFAALSVLWRQIWFNEMIRCSQKLWCSQKWWCSPPSSVMTTTMVSGPAPSGLKTRIETRYWVNTDSFSRVWLWWKWQFWKLLWRKCIFQDDLYSEQNVNIALSLMDLWVTLALGSSIRTSWASWGLVSRGLGEKDDNPNISVFRSQISVWFFSPVADEVSRELPVKRFEGGGSPLEVDRGGRGVVSCCHCWLSAWLWGESSLLSGHIIFSWFSKFSIYSRFSRFSRLG